MTIGELSARYADSERSGARAEDDQSSALARVSLVLQSTMAMIADAYDRMQPVIAAALISFEGMVVRLGNDASGNRMAGWLEAARRYDVSDEDIINAVNAIQVAFASGQSRSDGGSGKAWELLGITPQADPLDVLDQIPVRIKGLDQEYARSVLADIGIGDNVFRLLQQQGLSLDNSLGKNEGAGTGAPHAFRSLSSLGIVNSLLGIAGDVFDGIAGMAGDTPNARQKAGNANSATRHTLPVGSLNGWSRGGEPGPGGELGVMVDALIDPVRQLLTLFGNAYEASGEDAGGMGNVLEGVKIAFGKWEKIDPEKYASTMVEHLKTQALPAESVPVMGQPAASPVANVSVSQYIESNGDPVDMARQITREIEAAGRQYPVASY